MRLEFSQPNWYTLKSKRLSGRKKKESTVSGEIKLQFSIVDPANPNASPEEIYGKFKAIVCSGDDDDDLTHATTREIEEMDKDEETSDETDEPSKPEVVAKRRKRLRLARLKRRSIAARAYQFSSGAGNGVSGIVFLEISKITDLPPERNGIVPN